jgi:non-ribosomal peptide synthetase component E (peptide arylation enzyme)
VQYKTRQDPARAAGYRASGAWPDETFSLLLAQRVAESPNRPFLVDGQVRLTYRQVADAIDRYAAVLAASGLGPGDRVALQLPNWHEYVIVYYALERIGAISVAISIDFRSKEVEYILGFTGARGYIGCGTYKGFDYAAMIDTLRGALPNLRAVGVVRGRAREGAVCFDDAISASGAPVDFRPARLDPDAVTRILFTSGTTGNPKGVTHNHNTSLWPARMLNADLALTADEVMLLYLPLALNWGYLTIVQAVLLGASVVLMEKFDAVAALERIQSERVTFIPTAPASVVAMLNVDDLARYDTRSLRVIVAGGTSFPVAMIRAFRRHFSAALIELYGMLETGGFHTYTRYEDDPEAVAGTVGRPGSQMMLRICGEDGAVVPLEASGEIQCDGPGTQLGYLDNPDANAAAFTEDGWFRTGDLGAMDESGNLRIVGRLKEIINRGGKKYYPREIEEILYQHPAVLHCAVVGLPDERLGESNCLCVVPRPGLPVPDLGEFVDMLRDNVATYKLPERLVIMDALIYTATGKVQRHALVRRILEEIDGQ